MGGVVLVHGLYHQAGHFGVVAAGLRRVGVEVVVPELHRGSLREDTRVVQEAVDGFGVAPVVVGHSYGGSVITGVRGAGHLVYLAAFVLDAGESAAGWGGGRPRCGRLWWRPGRRVRPGCGRNWLPGCCTTTVPRRSPGVLWGCCGSRGQGAGAGCRSVRGGGRRRRRTWCVRGTGRSTPGCSGAWPRGAGRCGSGRRGTPRSSGGRNWSWGSCGRCSPGSGDGGRNLAGASAGVWLRCMSPACGHGGWAAEA